MDSQLYRNRKLNNNSWANQTFVMWEIHCRLIVQFAQVIRNVIVNRFNFKKNTYTEIVNILL